MLEGATIMLKSEPKPIWMVEICINHIHQYGSIINLNLFQTFQTFWDEGYSAFTANKELNKIYPYMIEKIIESGINTLNTHNFIFIDEKLESSLIKL